MNVNWSREFFRYADFEGCWKENLIRIIILLIFTTTLETEKTPHEPRSRIQSVF